MSFIVLTERDLQLLSSASHVDRFLQQVLAQQFQLSLELGRVGVWCHRYLQPLDGGLTRSRLCQHSGSAGLTANVLGPLQWGSSCSAGLARDTGTFSCAFAGIATLEPSP